MDLAGRFWSKVDRTGDCWEWKGARNQSGYGWFSVGSRLRRAHRIAYELTVGPVPSGMNVLHSCDNRACVRPEHLRVGTQRDNMADMDSRNRRFSPFRGQVQAGESNRQARLSEDDVREIRRLREAGGSLRDIAAQYGVSETNVCGIARRRFWAHVV